MRTVTATTNAQQIVAFATPVASAAKALETASGIN